MSVANWTIRSADSESADVEGSIVNLSEDFGSKSL